MSLASRLFSLIAPAHSSSYPGSAVSDIAGQHDGFAQPSAEFGIERENKRLRTMEALTKDEDLEMKRPPYLHVCPARCNATSSKANSRVVDAGRRGGRHKRRHSDALSRYCKDTSTGRPSLSSEIYHHVRHICQNLQTGRYSEGPVWWDRSSHAGIIPRHSDILWHIRILQETSARLRDQPFHFLSRRRYVCPVSKRYVLG